MWRFHNPVDVYSGPGCVSELPRLLKGRRYALVTYNEPYFSDLGGSVAAMAGEPVVVINDIQPNPDIAGLEALCHALKQCQPLPEVIVALGGGSVIDTAKFLAAAGDDFAVAKRYITTGEGVDQLRCIPIIAVPTTAGTGSEATCWATVWDKQEQRKYSLADARLYPEAALCDARLTMKLPVNLTLSTGLDALSHALESIWNKNRNPVSSALATRAASQILEVLPELVRHPNSEALREKMMDSALKAGLAFSNTKTSVAHNISYDVTLRFGTAHGIACSFTLPEILRSVIGQDAGVDADLQAIFGNDLEAGCDHFDRWLHWLGVKTSPAEYGYDGAAWKQLLVNALNGERGKNFIGQHDKLLACYAH